jgi:hypothetical protein
MSDGATTDLTILSGTMPEMTRDPRLMRLHTDNPAARISVQDSRVGRIDGRLGALEQSGRDLANEVSILGDSLQFGHALFQGRDAQLPHRLGGGTSRLLAAAQ